MFDAMMYKYAHIFKPMNCNTRLQRSVHGIIESFSLVLTQSGLLGFETFPLNISSRLFTRELLFMYDNRFLSRGVNKIPRVAQ